MRTARILRGVESLERERHGDQAVIARLDVLVPQPFEQRDVAGDR